MKNLKERVIILQPYKVLTHKNYFYQFETETGAKYACYFLLYKEYFIDYPAVADNIYSFNVDLIGKAAKSEIDERIAITIVSILQSFLQGLQNAVVYICDSSDERHLLRKRKFNAWFHQYDDGTIIKVEATAIIENMTLYNAILIHKDNKKEKSFYRSVSGF